MEDFTPTEKSGDCGYAGNEVLDDGNFVLTSYGYWEKDYNKPYIKSLRVTLKEIDEIVREMVQIIVYEKNNINNFKFIGSPIQITYFFYLLFINTRVISNDESLLFNKLVNFFYEKFGIYLNSKQKYLLNVWLFTINNGFSFLKKDYKFINIIKRI